MTDELDIENLDDEVEKEHIIDKRIKSLNDKVRVTAEDRDEKDRLLKEKLSENENLVKERDFLNSFGDQIGKHPEAAQFKDQIKERVLKGYSIEDATSAVLVAEGKYNPPQGPPPSIENIAGGSAPTLHQAGGEKSVSQLSREEKRAKLMEAEQRGDISVS